MHRLVHLPKFFNHVHQVHHLSTNPSPLAAQAFHPLEAILEMIWIVPIVFLIPLHQKVLLFFSLFSLVYNVYGHLSIEILPASIQQSFWGRWLNTSTRHNQHHQFYRGNYGLYFLFWDKLMQTERKNA